MRAAGHDGAHRDALGVEWTQEAEAVETPARKATPEDPTKAAVEAAKRLRAALAAHGITIPSLRASAPVMGRYPFIELGGTSADVADALAAVLEKAHEVAE
ncbi:hypothetical protein [Streptomyces sp. NPDC002758]